MQARLLSSHLTWTRSLCVLSAVVLYTAAASYLSECRAGSFECVDYREGFHVIGKTPLPEPLRFGQSVAARNGHIYVTANETAGDRSLLVYDVSLLGTPQLVNSVPLAEQGGEVTIEGDFLYVIASIDGFYVFDLTSPAIPLLRSYTAVPASTREITVENGVALVTSSGGGVSVWDVSNPDAPTMLSVIDPGHLVHNTAVRDGLAYLAGDYEGLKVYDVSNPEFPLFLDEYSFGTTSMYGVETFGQYVVALGQTAVYVFDTVSETLVSEQSGPFWAANDIEILRDQVYIDNGQGGAWIVDVSTPSAADLVATVGSTTLALHEVRDIAFAGNRLFAVGERNLTEAWITYTGSPMLLSGHNSLQDGVDKVRGVARSGDRAFLAGVNDVTVMDISHPDDTEVIGQLELGFGVECVAASGDVAMVGGASGFWVLDVSDPSNIVELDFLDIGTVRKIAIDGDYAILACESDGVRILDWSTPTSVIEVGSYSHEGQAVSVAVEGEKAYVAAYSGGTLCLDLTSPTSPSLLGLLDAGTALTLDIDVEDGLVCLATTNDGVKIVDFSNPAQPVELGSVETAENVVTVDMQGSTVVVGSREAAWNFVDLSDPADPTLVGLVEVYWSGQAGEVAIGDGFFVGGSGSGVSVVAMPCPSPSPAAVEDPRMVGTSGFAFPNPTHEGTVFRFGNPVPQGASVAVFDVTGQRVRVLEAPQPGNERVSWDGRSEDGSMVATGRYFCRVSSANTSWAVGVMVLR